MRQVGGVTPPGDEAAAAFTAAVAGLRSGQEQVCAVRPELTFEDVPAPRTLAPFATAFAATARVGGNEVASGRFVLLYDPAGQRGWAGPLRVIVYIRADLEPEIAADPMLGRGRLVLADRGARRPHHRLRGAQRDGDPGGHRGIRRQARGAADDRLRAAGLLVAAGNGGPGRTARWPTRRLSDGARRLNPMRLNPMRASRRGWMVTSLPGAGRSAPPPGCLRWWRG